MRRIQLAQIIGGSIDKPIGIQASQVVLSRQLSESLIQRGLKKCGSPEQVPAFGNIHRPKFARPFEDVLKDVAVDRFEKHRIAPAGEWGFDQLGKASMGTSSLERFELSRVSETAQVFEDGCAGVEIRVRILGR